jgi:MFS family permease
MTVPLATATTPHTAPVPRWAVLTVTWANSLGSGLLWSGVPFVTELQYGFTKGENLLLALAESVIYVLVALVSGPILRRFEGQGLTPRIVLMSIFTVQLLASALALTGMWGVIAASCIFSAVGAALWPIMESYVSSGQHGGNMRRSIGIFNVTWMSATGAALLLMAPLVATGHASQTLLVLAPISLLSMFLLRWFPKKPAAHPPEHAHTHIAPQYAYLLRATRFVVPTSYIFISVIGPVLPFILRDLAIEDGLKTPIASVWMFARMFTVVILAQLTFWHGRWSTLAVGISLLAGGFAAIVLATNVSMLMIGLALFGAGHGVIYYAGLYYAMAVGGAEVDAGGRFEALIGVGYVIGPVAGMLAGGTQAQLVGATWAAALLGIAPAIMPWLAWQRRLRSERRVHA